MKNAFFNEFAKEFVSGLVIIPIVWVLGSLFHIETESVEFVAAPVILAWFTVRGWRTEEPTWPFRRGIWKFVGRFLLATVVVVGMPLIIYGVVCGCILLLNLHRPPYILVSCYVAAVLVSGTLIWLGREPAVRMGMSFLDLSQATVAARARFAFYWLVSLALVANAVWPEAPEFDMLCAAARRAGGEIVDPLRAPLEGKQLSECVVRTQGDGYAVTIGAALDGDGDEHREITGYTAVLYPNGEMHHIEIIDRSPRDSMKRSTPKTSDRTEVE